VSEQLRRDAGVQREQHDSIAAAAARILADAGPVVDEEAGGAVPTETRHVPGSLSDPIPADPIPVLDPNLPPPELLAQIVDYLEGPPRLLERLIRLEDIVSGLAAMAEGAGRAGDSKHRRVIVDEAGRLMLAAELRQDEVNAGVRGKLLELFGVTSGLQSASLRLFGVLLLATTAILYIALRAAGL
jgi:hypothetical protein